MAIHDYLPVNSSVLAITEHALKGGELRSDEIKLLAIIVNNILTFYKKDLL